jgi:3-hydroxyacyl-CoA dehydrogenase
MAADLDHPDEDGFHFFNPVNVMPLIEIVESATDRTLWQQHST